MIQVKDNAIPKDKLRACEMWLEKANWSYGWPSNDKYPFGHWNIDIIAKPTNIQISYIVSKHRNGDPFVYDVPDQEGIYLDSVSKNQVFNLLKKIQQQWDEKYVV